MRRLFVVAIALTLFMLPANAAALPETKQGTSAYARWTVIMPDGEGELRWQYNITVAATVTITREGWRNLRVRHTYGEVAVSTTDIIDRSFKGDCIAFAYGVDYQVQPLEDGARLRMTPLSNPDYGFECGPANPIAVDVTWVTRWRSGQRQTIASGTVQSLPVNGNNQTIAWVGNDAIVWNGEGP